MIAERAEDFAMWTVGLLRNPDYCLRMGACGRVTAEADYDWSRCADQLVHLYASLTGFPAPERQAEEAVAR
jgi:glycosyltransferase involved in cell wall biosynthesis